MTGGKFISVTKEKGEFSTYALTAAGREYLHLEGAAQAEGNRKRGQEATGGAKRAKPLAAPAVPAVPAALSEADAPPAGPATGEQVGGTNVRAMPVDITEEEVLRRAEAAGALDPVEEHVMSDSDGVPGEPDPLGRL